MRAIVIATVIGLAAPSYAQVKIITGDVEHIYGPGGEILDGPQLRAKDQRAQEPDAQRAEGRWTRRATKAVRPAEWSTSNA